MTRKPIELMIDVDDAGYLDCALKKLCTRTTELEMSRRQECRAWTGSVISIRPTELEEPPAQRNRDVAETDRLYLDISDAVELEDPVLRRRIRVAKQNSRTTVVWNPWVQKARALPDLGDDEWTQMICIENSNVADFTVVLAPGQQHTMEAIVGVAGS